MDQNLLAVCAQWYEIFVMALTLFMVGFLFGAVAGVALAGPRAARAETPEDPPGKGGLLT